MIYCALHLFCLKVLLEYAHSCGEREGKIIPGYGRLETTMEEDEPAE